MERDALISKTEAYVREVMGRQAPALAVGHGFKHVDRVRNWALTYARAEKYPDLAVVEITALLHDIGLGHIAGPEAQRPHVVLPPHGPLGATMAAEYLRANSDLDVETIELIADAIRHHGDSPLAIAEYLKERRGNAALFMILRDADMTDAMGAVGLMRALTSKSFLPEYDPGDTKGPAWGLSTEEFVARGRPPVQTIVDQINQQIRYYDGLHTQAAREMCAPFVTFMKAFVIQLEHEVALPKRILARHTRYQGAIVRDGRVLLVKYLQRPSGRTFWVLPGGGIEPGETEVDCVRREMKEETNLDVTVVSLISDRVPQPEDKTLYRRIKTFLCHAAGGEPSPGIEPETQDYGIIEVGWFDLHRPDSWDLQARSDPLTVRMLESLRSDLAGSELA